MARRGHIARGRAGSRAGRRRSNRGWAATAFVVVAIVGVAAWLIGQGSGGGGGLADPSSTRTRQSARPPLATPYLGMPTVGRRLPTPSPEPRRTPLSPELAQAQPLSATSGAPVTLRAFRGKKVVLYFYEGST